VTVTRRNDCFAIAAPGLAPLVAAECVALGLTPVEVTPAGVALSLTEAELFTLNCWSRVASRVLVRLAQFDARDFATLEKQAARVPWDRVLPRGATVALRVTCRKSRLYHSDAVAERVARGIVKLVPGATVVGQAGDDEAEADDTRVDEARVDEAPGRAVMPAADAPPQLIVVRFERDHCTISADSSGVLLHKRGWRQAIAKAPLRETLAAAMVAACDWHGEMPLVDPFCGSGTIGIEAALRARRIAPGVGRAFAMEQWPRADAAAFARIRAEARAGELPAVGAPIMLRDRDAGACAAARANAERAGVLGDVVIEQGALSDTDLAPLGAQGLVLTNPPYGLRVSEGADLRGLYARLGDVLREGGRGWRVGLLVPDRRVAGQMKIRLEPLFATSNGGIGVELLSTFGRARSAELP
jgi:putative N6-adenine-specific DNA methylase